MPCKGNSPTEDDISGRAKLLRRIFIMKIAKILSAAAAAVVAVSAVAVSASADFRAITDGAPYLLSDGTGNYGICVYSDGDNKDGVPAVNIDGLDLSAITHVAFTFDVIDDADNRDWWDGMGGGAIVVSAHSDLTADDADLYSKYNWATAGNFWGVVDEDLGLETADPAQGLVSTKVGDYTYKIEADVINPLADGDIGTLKLYRIFMQAWSFTMSDIEVVKTELSDSNGNVLATFDAKGNLTLGGTSAPAADDTSAPADDATDATGAGSTTASDSKGSPDTGVEGVAAVAGVAIVAAGAVVLSKKRK